LVCIISLGLPLTSAKALPAPKKDVIPEAGVQVLARGPVHEAYAQPVPDSPQPTPMVPKQPPAPIPEEPPDQKPQANNVEWIPGYWSWDTDKKDFIWVSGFWRVPPPERRWVPGHWSKSADGWQWTPGFWIAQDQESWRYLPQPPASLDNGLSISPPDENNFYVPGEWRYRDPEFAWRSGFWFHAYSDWVWIPGSYRWTPSGYIYVDGYWDYTLEDRGLLFAPVSFDQPLWAIPGWCYRPSFAVNVGGLCGSLFVNFGCGHYYFGDYYDPVYSGLGFAPWYAFGRRHCDPLFTYYSWAHRGNPGWYRNLQDTHVGRVNGTQVRPARTLVAPTARIQAASSTRPSQAAPRLVSSLATSGVALTRVSPTQLSQQRSAIQRFRDVSVQRNRWETATAMRSDPGTRQSYYFGAGQASAASSVPGGRDSVRLDSGRSTAPIYSTPSFQSRPVDRGVPSIQYVPSRSSSPGYQGGGSFRGGNFGGGSHGSMGGGGSRGGSGGGRR
jgi:hypothetical protein